MNADQHAFGLQRTAAHPSRVFSSAAHTQVNGIADATSACVGSGVMLPTLESTILRVRLKLEGWEAARIRCSFASALFPAACPVTKETSLGQIIAVAERRGT